MFEHARLLNKLPEDGLADIYLAAEPLFPPEERTSARVAPVDSAREFVRSIPSHIAARGTTDAVRALERIVAQRPDLDWVRRRVLVDARRKLREQSWNPPTIDQLRVVLGSRGRGRVVRNPIELLVCTEQSLSLVEDVLQGRTGGNPQAQFLWNADRPKPEDQISNYLAHELGRTLRERAVLTNREVQIRPSRLTPANAPQGQRTDILLQAVSSHDEPFSVVVEVKGCWNREVKTAMKDQLLKRYLIPNGFRHGLYVVVWFVCDTWAPNDNRKMSTTFPSIEDARDFFVEQAASLSSEHDLEIHSLILDATLS